MIVEQRYGLEQVNTMVIEKISHIEIAHMIWKELLKKGDRVIDATLGTGKDAAFLTRELVIKKEGELYGFDIQKSALEQAEKRVFPLLNNEQMSRVKFFHRSHATFPEEIEKGSIALIVYNLGYLPGGDKQITTLTSSTLQSLENAKELLRPNGTLSITCYPGHEEGQKESEELEKLLATFPKQRWNITRIEKPFSPKSPYIFLVQQVNE